MAVRKRDMAQPSLTATPPVVQDFIAFCEGNGWRATEPRCHVLGIIASGEKPLGAYDVLDRLGRVTDNPKPPTVYRAIEFLQEHGFVHRIESLNAFVACRAGHRHNGSQFMICDSCGTVEEAHLCHMPQALQQSAEKRAFQVEKWSAELHGVCGQCTAKA